MLMESQQVLIKVNQIKVYVKKMSCLNRALFCLFEGEKYDTLVEKSGRLSGLS